MKHYRAISLIVLCCLVVFVFALQSESVLDDFVKREGSRWRVHWSDRHVAEAIYGRSRPYGASSSQAASAFLRSNSRIFDIDNSSSLKLIATDTAKSGEHLLFQQFHGGLPVVGGQMRVCVDYKRRITSVAGKYHPIGTIRSSRVSGFESATQTARRLFQSESHNTGMMILPEGKTARFVWRVEVEPRDTTSGSWLLYVDATDPQIIRHKAKTHVNAQGEGNVWNENPVTTPNRSVQPLLNMDSSRTLSGKFARLYNANFEEDAALPIQKADFSRAKEADRKFHYSEEDARLPEVMGYYHINRVHDRWRSFWFSQAGCESADFVNVAAYDGGPGYDNAHYSRSRQFRRTGVYVFGGGDRYNNSALDSEVLYHEYGHGVLDRIAPGFLEARESAYPWAVHEAFGDISAAAITETPRLFDFGFALKGSNKWRGRKMNNRNKFPKHVVWKKIGFSEPHYTCLILNGAWWDLQKKIGAIPAQELIYDAMFRVSDDVDFFQVRDGMLSADQDLNKGANQQAIVSAFSKHGLSGPNPGQKGTLNVTNVVVAAYSANSDYHVTSTVSRGETASILVEYQASGLTPGYNLVPVDFEFIRPGGSDAIILGLIPEVTNGTHTGVREGLHLFEIPTSETTVTGTYTVRFKPRLGGTSNVLAERSVTFTLQ